MGRKHIPFGYRIENGAAVVIPEKAVQVREIYDAYLAGKAYEKAARTAGLFLPHTSVKRLLQNKHYLGDEFYPAIIDRPTFEAAEAERLRRAELLGRTRVKERADEPRRVKSHFTMRPAANIPMEAYERAAYIYSLIESEE